jgi:preprotein translocase subunit SecD
LRLVADENAVIDPTLYEKVEIKGTWPEASWILRQTAVDGRDIEKAFITKSEPLLTPQQMALMKKDPRMKPIDPQLEKAFTIGGEPEINIKFMNPAKIAEVTKQNVGKKLAMVLDGVVLMAPVIHEPLTAGEAKISGKWTEEEASRIVNRLNALNGCR